MNFRAPFDDMAEAWEQEFARNRSLHGERLQCRAGCDSCCSQMFHITELEAAVVSAGVQQLEPAARQHLQTRATAYLETRRQLAAEQGIVETWGHLPLEGTRLACPALEAGVCQIYEHRPLICRKFGIPLWNPTRQTLQACELNFRAGDEINDAQLIQIQTPLHQSWRAVQATYNAQSGHRDTAPLTVARAIAQDCSAWLETGPTPTPSV
jgi:Fe-S-cluster containining protein